MNWNEWELCNDNDDGDGVGDRKDYFTIFISYFIDVSSVFKRYEHEYEYGFFSIDKTLKIFFPPNHSGIRLPVGFVGNFLSNIFLEYWMQCLNVIKEI